MDNDESYYAISVWDYFMPSCCSGSKFYFGTLSQIGDFIERLKSEGDNFQDTLAAFDAYLKGDTQVCHNVAYNNQLLLRPAKRLAYREGTIEKQDWTFWNVWHWPCEMWLERAQLKHAIFQMEGTFYRCISASMQGLAYEDMFAKGEYREVAHLGFGGHPGFLRIENDGKTISSALYTVERCYKNRKKALKHFAGKFNLDCMCEEIFGSG